MIASKPSDADFLAARLHARRSRMAEGGRLEALCRLPDATALVHAVYPDHPPDSIEDFQRLLLEELSAELAECATHLSGAAARLLDWIPVRFQTENLKVLLRGARSAIPLAALAPHLLPLPPPWEVDRAALAAARDASAFARLLPRGPLREELRAAAAHGPPTLFFHEAALDRAYLAEALARARNLPAADRELALPLLQQETDLFHLMLVARGRFVQGLAAADLEPLHVAGGGLGRSRLAAMLADPDLRTAARRAIGRVIDSLPEASGDCASDAAALEAAAWTREHRLANRAFRRSHIGPATAFGYACLRRIEVANLITASECLRTGMREAALRSRLLPRGNREASHA